MLCEKCKKNTANVFYNENINGKTRSYALCSDCAEKMQENGEIQDMNSMFTNFADPFAEFHDPFFSGFFGMPALRSAEPEKKCPVCGSTYSDIAKTGRVGCPQCYETFGDELSDIIGSVHGTTSHTGNVPSRHRAKKERDNKLKTLKKDLENAIKAEEYEKAATLRDEIRSLQNENEKEGK